MAYTKTILVTGAARGIGFELIRQYAHEDPTTLVIAAVRDTAKADQVLELIKSGVNVKLVQLDSTDDASIAASVPKVQALTDHVDLLINNAGILPPGDKKPAETTRPDFLTVLDVNSAGPLAVFNAYEPLLKAAKGNAVVANISSTVGSIAHPFGASGEFGAGKLAYGVSKAALNYITRALATTYTDITFLALCPGWLQTDMGGASAPLKVEDGVKGVRNVIATRTLKDSGKYINHENQELPF